MNIDGHLDIDKKEMETEFLRKRMDTLSNRLTLAFFCFAALLGIFLVLAYLYIGREIENLKQEQAEILAPDHVFSQKFDQLTNIGNLLSEEIRKQTESLETARKDLEKNSNALSARIKSLEQSDELQKAKQSLARLEESEKAMKAAISEMENQLAAVRNLPALVAKLEKGSKDMTITMQAILKKQTSLENDIALFPVDSVQKGELDAAIRRQDTARSSLENRINRLQILVDSMSGSSSGRTSQETLQE